MKIIKNALLPLAILCIIAENSCKKNANSFCGATNPATDVPWVKNLIDNHGTDSLRIYKLTYESKEGFIISYPMASSFRDCNNNQLCSYSAGGIAGGVWYCTDYSRPSMAQMSSYDLIYSNY